MDIDHEIKLENKREKKIVIVDDDPDTCTMLSYLFQSNGYRTASCFDGKHAVECLKVDHPDLVLLDVMMPEWDGLDTYRRIRAESDVPVVFLSALESEEKIVEAIHDGALDYIRKPYLTNELLARVEAVFERYISGSAPMNDGISRPRTSLIIPTLNEAANLPLVLPILPMDWIDEVILVDGHSTDGTVEVARRLFPSVKVLMEKKKGKGAAMNAGYCASTGDIIVVLDADGSHDPREIPRFINALLEGSDFVKGSRTAHGGGTTDMPRYRKMGNYGLTRLVNVLFGSNLSDLCYGYHAFWRYCLQSLDIADFDGFEIDTALYIRALQQKLRITEVPSFEGYRFHGEGKLRTLPDGYRVLRTIVSEYVRLLNCPTEAPYLGFRGACIPVTNRTDPRSLDEGRK